MKFRTSFRALRRASAATRWTLLALVAALVLALAGVAVVLAGHDVEKIEMDGNVVDGSAAGTDWAAMLDTGASPTYSTTFNSNVPSGTIAKTFVRDFVLNARGPDSSYHEPSNKDDQAIYGPNGSGVWGCGSVQNPTDKDDVLSAMALAVDTTDPDPLNNDPNDTDRFIYFAGDRFSNDGTAFMGIWFFQRKVVCDTATGKFINAEDPTQPGKITGDILILANFSKGGAPGNVTLTAFKWTAGATPDAAGTFTPVAGAADARCSQATAGDDICAEVNFGDTATNGTFTSDWPFQDKNTPKNTIFGTVQLAEFFEGVFNQSDALHPLTDEPEECFSTFLMETRSSDSLDATLKDYALGSFETCGNVTALKYHDLNANGQQDTGEPGLSGWTIFIDKDADEILDSGEISVTTDVNGEASFSDLQAGTYSFCEVLQSNWINSDPAGTTICKTETIAVSATKTIKFGNYQNATKSGVKFHDLNSNSAKNTGEPLLSGWVINVYTDTNGNGSLDASEFTAGAVFSDTTDGTGYSFSLTPGKYIVCEEAQTGWQQTYPTGNTKCSAGTGLAPAGYGITLASADQDTDNDFGNVNLFKLIVITCNTTDETLVDSTVTLNSTNKQTIINVSELSAALQAKGITAADLCSIPGASYDNLTPGTYAPSVELPDVAPLFP